MYHSIREMNLGVTASDVSRLQPLLFYSKRLDLKKLLLNQAANGIDLLWYMLNTQFLAVAHQ